MTLRLVAVYLLLAALAMGATMSETTKTERSLDEMVALMARARAGGLVGIARKTRPVDARPARATEVVVTVIAGEGKETQSRPAREGDWVVRNRCPETGNEQYLVGGDKFGERYRAAGLPPGADGWQEFQPVGKDLRFLVLPAEEGAFSFTAPWGEAMVARPGDAILQDPQDEKDVYRVAAASFACTYEVVTPAERTRP
ncbi:MAG TPA: hypothetical protein VIZ31_04775 [Vicinamibacteria bacterium]